MNKFFRINVLFITLLTVLLSYSCSDDDNDEPKENGSKNSNYILLTGDMGQNQAYATAYANMPSGDVNNIKTGSLVFDCNGLQSFGNWVFKRASPNKKQATLFRYSVNEAGNLVEDNELSGSQASSRFIYNDTLGFYTAADLGLLKIQKFNPSTIQRTGEIDLSHLKSSEFGYQAVGTSLMVAKEGKLYVNYYTNKENQEENYRKNTPPGFIQLVVIDIKTQKYEKTIRRDGINFIGYPAHENQMWCIGDDGALYLCSHGFGPTGITNNSAIVRIKKGETDFDQNWIIEANKYTQGTTFGAVCVKNNKLYTLMSTTPMKFETILTDDTYNFYTFDKEDLSKAPTLLKDIPSTTYPFVCGQVITEIDNKIYFRVVNNKGNNGYYVLDNDNTFKQAFNVNSGGVIWGLCKLVKKDK